jgi:hypothetical protein
MKAPRTDGVSVGFCRLIHEMRAIVKEVRSDENLPANGLL